MTPEQFQRLPRYAQNEITRLGQDVERLRRQVLQVSTGDTDTWIRSADYLGVEALPRGAQVRFGTPDHNPSIDVRIDPPTAGGISGYPSSLIIHGSDALAFELSSANLAIVYMARPIAGRSVLCGPHRARANR